MPKAVRFSTSIPVSSTSSEQSDYNQFVSVALFAGIGLLISLVVIILFNVPVVWD
jgi:cobalamin synthase